MIKRIFVFLSCILLSGMLNSPAALSSPLHDAVYKGDVKTVLDLLEKKWDVNAKDSSDETALHWAVFRGHPEIARILIDKGADVNLKDANNATPLFLAASKGHLDITRILLEKGADPNIQGNNNWTSLHMSISKGYTDIARLLLDKGADPNATGNSSWTPLHIAADKGNPNIVRILLDKGANVNARNSEGVTPLLNALEKGHIGIALNLLDKGADVNVTVAAAYNWTPLHYASIRGYSDIARILLNKGADVNAKGSDNSTPLFNAAYGGYSNIVSMLLKSGADPGMAGADGKTPLSIAEEKGNTVVVKLLRSAEEDAETKLGTPATASIRISPLLDEAGRLEDAERFLEAVKVYDKVLELQPDHKSAQEGRARALEGLEKAFDDALSRGKRYADAGNITNASEGFKKALELKPDNEKAKEGLREISERVQKWVTERLADASSSLKSGRYSEAVSKYKTVISVDRENKQAIAGLQNAIRLRDEAVSKKLAAGTRSYKEGNYSQAIAMFNEVLQIDGTNMEAQKMQREARSKMDNLISPWLKVGTDASRQGDENAAIVSYKKALNVDPDNREAREYLGSIGPIKAKASVENEIEKHYLRGVGFYTDGKYRDSIESWKRVLELDPRHEKALMNIERAKKKMEGVLEMK